MVLTRLSILYRTPLTTPAPPPALPALPSRCPRLLHACTPEDTWWHCAASIKALERRKFVLQQQADELQQRAPFDRSQSSRCSRLRPIPDVYDDSSTQAMHFCSIVTSQSRPELRMVGAACAALAQRAFDAHLHHSHLARM